MAERIEMSDDSEIVIVGITIAAIAMLVGAFMFGKLVAVEYIIDECRTFQHTKMKSKLYTCKEKEEAK
jgi:hypothetical protein